MDLNKLIERYTDQALTAKKEMTTNLAADLLAIVNEGGAATFIDTQPTTIPNRKPLPLMPLASFPAYTPEADNPSILIKGRWLERGGSAWWISTAGTGKSIVSIQLSLLWAEGLPFAGLTPNGMKLTIWIIQSEDSPSRVTIDREDVITELTEQHPDIDWRKTAERVKFVNLGPHVGADFLDKLDTLLDRVFRDDTEKMPDVIIMNPFLAYIGGPITDGSYVTPFLRGGEINRKPTVGLQAILEKYDISTLIFHHTPKPPNDDQLDAWMRSPFPEYQGAGSSDITNWGRSFITMMRCKDDSSKVMLTAGKNGGEIGWQQIDGATRHYLAHSDAKGITGKARHAWRELTEDELAEVTHEAKVAEKTNEEILVDALKQTPMTATEIRQYAAQVGMTTRPFNSAWKKVSKSPADYGLVCLQAQRIGGRGKVWYFGEKEATKHAVWKYETET